ncbi:hypothetical protein EG832_22610 [bacterium]|nr:hypothetical protein [bacterium]
MTCGQFLQICDATDKLYKTQGRTEKAGGKMHPYCEEFLSRVYRLKTADGHICPENDMNPEDLLMILEHYVARNSPIRNVSAGIAIHNAYREAFPCQRSHP